MKTFQMDNKPNVLEFANFERKDEEVIFHEVLASLQKKNDIVIGVKKVGPSEDIYECSVSKLPFTIIYDVNYGVSIHSKDSKAIRMLTEYLK